jgi:hypothetical protein
MSRTLINSLNSSSILSSFRISSLILYVNHCKKLIRRMAARPSKARRPIRIMPLIILTSSKGTHPLDLEKESGELPDNLRIRSRWCWGHRPEIKVHFSQVTRPLHRNPSLKPIKQCWRQGMLTY